MLAREAAKLLAINPRGNLIIFLSISLGFLSLCSFVFTAL